MIKRFKLNIRSKKWIFDTNGFPKKIVTNVRFFQHNYYDSNSILYFLEKNSFVFFNIANINISNRTGTYEWIFAQEMHQNTG